MSTLSFLNKFVMYSELRSKSHAPVFSFHDHTTDGYLDVKKFQHKIKIKERDSIRYISLKQPLKITKRK